MELRIDKTGQHGVLMLGGALTIHCAEEAKSLLLSAMGSIEDVALDLSGVTEIDLCGFQLLCSAWRTARQRNKRVAHVGAIPVAFLNAAEEAGECIQPGCAAAGHEKCPWKRGRG